MNKTELQADIQQKLSYLSERKLAALRTMLDAMLDNNPTPDKPARKTRGLVGSMPDLVKYMADDFNEPLDDFKDYMPK